MFPKTKYLCFLLFFSFFLGTWNLGLGASNVDSLRTALSLAKEDTNKVNLLNNLGGQLKNNNPDTSIILSNQALSLAKKLQWKKGISITHGILGVYNRDQGNYRKALEHYFMAYEIAQELGDKSGIAIQLGNIGIVYDMQGDYTKAMEHYFKALEITQEMGDKSGIARHLGNIGGVCYQQGDYPKALEQYFKSLEIAQELGDKRRIAIQLGSIGLVYYGQGDYSKALEHYFKALEITQEMGDKSGMAIWLGNIGNVYFEQGDYTKALELYFKALEIAKEFGVKIQIAIWLGNIGSVYDDKGDYSKALEHYFKALEIDKELGNKRGIAIRLGNIGALYTSQKRFAQAEDYLNKSLAIAKEIGSVDDIKEAHQNLSALYSSAPASVTLQGLLVQNLTGLSHFDKLFHLAHLHYQKYLQFKDTLFNQDKSESMGKLEARHEFALLEMEMALRLRSAAEEKAAAVKRRDKIQFTGVAAGLVVVVLIVALLVFSKFKIAPKIKTGSLFIALILLFEFMLVWFDPAIEKFTGGNPGYKLMINALLAMGFYFGQQLAGKLLPVTSLASTGKINTIGMAIICIYSFVHLCGFSFVPSVVKEIQTTKLALSKAEGSTKNVTKETKVDSLKLLLSQYEKQSATLHSQNKIKEALETLKKYGNVKDTLQSMEQSQEEAKIKEHQAMEIQKQKQKQTAEEKEKIEKAKKERKDLLIYSIILIAIIFLFIVFSVTGRVRKGKFVMPQRILEGGLFVSFLLFFEFILVFADPYMEQYTGGAPLWKFGFNVVVAGLIFPVHEWMEGRMRAGMFKMKKEWGNKKS